MMNKLLQSLSFTNMFQVWEPLSIELSKWLFSVLIVIIISWLVVEDNYNIITEIWPCTISTM